MSDKELKDIANGKYADRLNFLRINAQARPVEEFYLLFNTENVESAAKNHFARRAYTLESWRNGLLLLPLFLTSFSLCLAAIVYRRTSSPESFLKQWADGFSLGANQPIPSPLSFIWVAVIDVVLILILLLLTVFTQTIKSSAQQRAAELRIWLDEELYRLASSSLVKSLGPGPGDSQPAWAVEVHSAINHLTQALTEVDKLVNASHIALQNIVQASQEKLEESAREFRVVITDQREAIGKFMDSTTEVRRAVDKLERIYMDGEHIYQGLNATLPKIDQSFSIIATRQDNAASALEAMNNQTNLATKAVGDIAAQFVQTNLVQTTYQAATSMQQTAEIMRSIAIQMSDTVNRQIQLQIHLEQQTNHMPPSQFPNPL